MKYTPLLILALFLLEPFLTCSFTIPALQCSAAVKPTKTGLGDAAKATETTTNSNSSSDAAETPASSPKSGKVRKILTKCRNLISSTRASYPFVPIAFALGLGYKLGRQAAKSTAETSSKQAATATRFPALSAVLVAVAVREGWRNIPSWMKRRVPFVGGKQKVQQEEVDPDDLTSIPAIWGRIQNLLNLVEEKVTSTLEPAAVQAAFFSLVQLIAQVKEQQAEYRDDGYCESGELAENPKAIMGGLDEAFEFADWAYDELPDEKTLREAFQELNFELLRHEKIALPGFVSHYVAISTERKLVVIGVKGTSNFEDMITDCCGETVPFELDAPFVPGVPSDTIRCHDGILLASKRLANDLQTLVEALLLPTGYKLLITGHSLGAGVAALTSIILRSRIPSLLEDDGNTLSVLAFAPPPVLDYESSLACRSFITSIVNNADIIPRSSLANLRGLFEVLKTIYHKLEEKGIAPTDAKGKRAFMAKLVEGKGGEMIMTTQEIRNALNDAYDKVELNDPDHLYVPGRVIHMFDLWSKEGYGEKATQETDDDAEEDNKVTRTAERAYRGDGASKPLRYFEIDTRMISDHLAPDYRSSIKALLSDAEDTGSKVR